jgi:hypothetical protein
LKKEVRTMKFRMTIMMVIVLALIVGSVYAGEGNPVAREENGFTVFSVGPVALDNGTITLGPGAMGSPWVAGHAAGGMREEAPRLESYNGITTFSDEPIALDDGAIVLMAKSRYSETGAAAGGLREEASSKKLYNGCTVFSVGPVAFDNGTIELNK